MSSLTWTGLEVRLTRLTLNNSNYDTSARDEGTAFTAKSKFSQGNIYLRQEKYREAIDSYYEAKELFESIGDIDNAQKAGQAYDEAIEMRCEFGDYCLWENLSSYFLKISCKNFSLRLIYTLNSLWVCDKLNILKIYTVFSSLI